jgi:hypothetical protein
LLDFELKCVGDSLVPEAHFTAARVRVLSEMRTIAFSELM